MKLDFLEDKLTDLACLIEEIDSSIGNWKEFYDDTTTPEDIEKYQKEDAILKDLVGSLKCVHHEFIQQCTT